MIPIATKTVLNSDSVPQSINLEGSDIKLANIVHNLGVCLDPTLSCNSKSPPCVVYAIWKFVGLIQYATICPKRSPKELLFFQGFYCNSLLGGCPRYLLSKFQKVQNNAARLIFRTSRSAHVLLCFILFTGYLLSRGSNTNCFCFALR